LGRTAVPGPNDRIEIGVIGVGIRGKYLIGNLPPEARVTALCDCYMPRVHEAKKPDPNSRFAPVLETFVKSDAANCSEYADYRRMLDRARLDAVIIAACDHHHVQAAMLACQAGLDVYCEKPLSLTIGEGRRLVQAVRRYGRVLQVGSQQRSMEMNRFACEFVRHGGLGQIKAVEAQNWPGPLPEEDLAEEPIPTGMHWDLFCGPRPLQPYAWRRWMKDEQKWNGERWRGWDMWRDYSGHLMTNWGAHAIDMIQWALGMDHTGPVEFEPLVDEHDGPMRTCPVVAKYANGVEVRMVNAKGIGGGGGFEGERGDLIISRNRFRAMPAKLVTDPPDPAVAEIWQGDGHVARPHLQNWLDCVKSRKEPVAPVEVGHRTATICHLAGIARELKRKLRWDPDAETFPGDAEACALIDRPRRSGWELPEIS
jgi:predicted dehydrogenase